MRAAIKHRQDFRFDKAGVGHFVVGHAIGADGLKALNSIVGEVTKNSPYEGRSIFGWKQRRILECGPNAVERVAGRRGFGPFGRGHGELTPLGHEGTFSPKA